MALDHLAVGARASERQARGIDDALVRGARGLGLQVAQDLPVVGFATLHAAEAAEPPLTTVAQPFQEMGRMAARRLLQLIGDEEGANGNGNGNTNGDGLKMAPLEESLPTHLVVRGSTAPVQVSPRML